ncbi:MAG: hypothetical protein KA267_07675 [Gemmatimonadales bacterium]|jgi:hypothetical protein|nr:hypothetical protein [Gemmatimonadota bacterium]MBP6443881.1 hypothetical protein [Gemmatimonadales bacterium]MBP6570494.1 hypothetical protein [Gemmatimonadales bacterium]MBP7620293.1 hypothetical protein [Gemmatimonadales bacterium]
MAKDACLECGKPFPANAQLASVPLARLVAFDPDANRVWRICDACDGWNLLGPEASRGAIPELVARHTNEPSAGRGGIAMTVLGRRDVVLFRLGTPPTRLGADLAASEAHAEIGAPIPWDIYATMGLLFLAAASLSSWVRRFPTVNALLDRSLLLLAAATFFTVRGLLASRELWRGQPAALRLLPVVGLPAIAFMFGEPDVPLWGGLVTILLATAAGLWAGRRAGSPRGIRWSDSGDALTYHDGITPSETGQNALVSLSMELQREFNEVAKPADRDAAWTLWKRHESVGALVESFASRRRRDGLLRLTDLSASERMALLIAVSARLAEPPAEVIAGLQEAERVAAIAETLDLPAELG